MQLALQDAVPSQSSPAPKLTTLFPHNLTQFEDEVADPPEHSNPYSILHSAEHPSPFNLFASSQSSKYYYFPSPQ